MCNGWVQAAGMDTLFKLGIAAVIYEVTVYVLFGALHLAIR